MALPESLLSPWVSVALLTLVPWIELRGSIPLGLALELPWPGVFLLATAANVALFWPVWLVLHLGYERLLRRTFVGRLVERVRERGRGLVERYGAVGLALFVAVPLPGTGAYSGTALAFVMGVPPGRAFVAIGAGVVAAGIVVTLVSTGVLAGLRLL
ncbi:MAG: small multi-drug export protein [Firmicutes bacterium]|nr:small multi-drug export protein [Bacillota bacterium]